MTRVAEVLGLLKPNDVIHGWWGGDWLSCIAILAGHETHEPRRVNTPNLFGKSNLSFEYKTALRWTYTCCDSKGCQQIVNVTPRLEPLIHLSCFTIFITTSSTMSFLLRTLHCPVYFLLEILNSLNKFFKVCCSICPWTSTTAFISFFYFIILGTIRLFYLFQKNIYLCTEFEEYVPLSQDCGPRSEGPLRLECFAYWF